MLTEDLNLFAIVSELGTLSAAARIARTNPSTVSRRIAALEGEVGVKLFNRTTRRLALTPEGRIFLDRCIPFLRELEDVRTGLREGHAEPSGLVRISSSIGFGSRYLAPLVGEFRRLHPAVGIDLRLQDERIDLTTNEADIAVRIGRLPDSSLRTVRLASLRRIACASPSYLALRGQPECPADLLKHECILVGTAGQSGGAWRFRETRALRIEPQLTVSSHEAATIACLSGAGIAHLPSWLVAAEIEHGRLVRLLEPYEIASNGGVHLLWRDHAPAKVRTLVAFLRERIGALGLTD